MGERGVWLITALATVMLAALIGFGASGVALVVLALLGFVLYSAVGWSLRRPVDEAWLPRWIGIGFVAKIFGTIARYYVLVVLYDSGGDAVRYYRAGLELAAQWSTGRIPPLTGSGGFGTQVTEAVTGAIFAVFTPDMLGGFMIFSIIAYMGQLLLYAAFRRWAPARALKPYAILILLLPTYSFWPSSIGKDALILLGLGSVAYAAARALEAYELRWLVTLAIGFGIVAVIRAHVAVLLGAALAVTAVVARMRPDLEPAAYLRRLVVIGAFSVASVLAFTLFSDLIGIDLSSTENVDDFAADIVRRTTERGTVASGNPVSGPQDIPAALALVLFRPYILEATELQHLFAAAETTALALLTLWLLPQALRNWRSWRSNAYVVFCTVYTVGFAIAFSVVRNLGIIARQRGQVLALFLAALLIMGWKDRAEPEPDPTPQPTVREAPRPVGLPS